MTPVLEFRPEALADIEEAAAYYEVARAGLGERFLSELGACVRRILARPLLYPEIYRNLRRAKLHRFPFNAIYLPRAGTVHVVAVLHGARDPAVWRMRI